MGEVREGPDLGRVATGVQDCNKDQLVVLEMISGEPNPISGGRNEVFGQPLVRYRKCGKSFMEGENKREIKGQIRVVLRLVSFVLFSVKKRNLEDKASPTTNDSQDNSVTKQPCFGEQPTVLAVPATKLGRRRTGVFGGQKVNHRG